MPEILPNPFTDPAKLPKRSLFDVKKDEQQSFIDQAMAQGLKAANESTKKKFSDPELQKIWDNIEEKIENGEIKIHEITIGGKTKDQLIEEIEAAGMTIGDSAKEIMENINFKINEEKKDRELIELSVSDLGFPNGSRRDEIYKRAVALGFEVVPAEVGPQLRLQYPDQPKGVHILIGMKPIEDSSADALCVFELERSGPDRILEINFNGDPDYRLQRLSHLVFRRN